MNKLFACSHCMICVLCSVHLKSTYYVRKGLWAFYLNNSQVNGVKKSDHMDRVLQVGTREREWFSYLKWLGNRHNNCSLLFFSILNLVSKFSLEIGCKENLNSNCVCSKRLEARLSDVTTWAEIIHLCPKLNTFLLELGSCGLGSKRLVQHQFTQKLEQKFTLRKKADKDGPDNLFRDTYHDFIPSVK